MAKVVTQHIKEIFDSNTAKDTYKYLKKNIKWEEGIYSKREKQTSRLAYHHNPESDSTVDIYIQNLVSVAINEYGKLNNLSVVPYYGVYINYYRDGNDFCPNHSHKDTKQLVLSFGAVRPLTIGKKEYELQSGDAIAFGSSIHGIPKDSNITRGRISIAIFIAKLNS
jgi:hypothetical protein